ncbi:hypothetical protein [Paenarthrobacter ilicis]
MPFSSSYDDAGELASRLASLDAVSVAVRLERRDDGGGRCRRQLRPGR